MTAASWADAHIERVARAIRTTRGTRSARWLSDRTAELGHRVSRTSISEIETGHRKTLSTVELLILARALEVSPAQLLFPDLPDGEVEMLPGETVSSIDAVMWLSGEEWAPTDFLQENARLREGVRLAQASRRRERAMLDRDSFALRLDRYERIVESGKMSNDHRLIVETKAKIEAAEREYELALSELYDIPGAVLDDVDNQP